jgi:tetratricopeptide (TPR) repeat protein
VARLERAVNGLGWFYLRGYGNYQRGRITFRRLARALEEAGDRPSSTGGNVQRAMARVLAWQASICTLLGDLATSGNLIGQSQALLDDPALAGEEVRLERAQITFELGYHQLYTDAETARTRFSESLELYRQLDHRWGMGYALLGLGRAHRNLGALAQAREAMTQSLSWQRAIGNAIGQSEALAALGGVALRQGQLQEAEDLIRQSLSLTPEGNRFGRAYGLGILGDVQLLTGRLAEAEATYRESIRIFEDLGWRMWAVNRSVGLAYARLHAGDYDAARNQAENILSRAQDLRWPRGTSRGMLLLAQVTAVQGAGEQAYGRLIEDLASLRDSADDPEAVARSVLLAVAARGLGRRSEAWQGLALALDAAAKRQRLDDWLVVLAGTALLLADDGEAERAVEVYALASRHPFVAHSRWFQELFGREIAAAAASLPLEVKAAAEERGRARELVPTVEVLAAELRGRV